MITAILIGSALTAAALDGPPCLPSQQGATVGAMSRIAGQRRTGAVTRSGRTPQPVAIAEGDILCAGEILTNPRGSAVRVVITLAGGMEVPLGPGAQTSIPAPGSITRLGARTGQFNMLFSPDAHRGGGVRGGDEEDGEEQVMRVVLSWGPVPLNWQPREEDGRSWTVRLTEDGRTRSANVSRPFVLVDLSNGCARGCSIAIAGSGGRIVQRLRVVPAAQADVPLPRWLDHVTDNAAELALLGAWLVDRLGVPAWAGQGYTLMWGSACAYPAVAAHLAQHLGTIAAGEPCTSRPLAFRSR